MKYTYKNKKTYKIKNKLKILLTILLVALITTTGYILSKNVFSKLDYEYFNETTSDGINIKVVGERGVIPSNSTLKIEKVSKEEKDNVDNSINDVKDNNMNTIKSYTYDIKILNENNKEIEPSEEIKIIFINNLINNKNLDTNIYHTSIENDNLTTEVLKGEVEGETITTKTDSFSYYTVEFTYNSLTYSIEGDSEVKLSDILNEIGLAGEVSEVSGSNNNLFSFEKKDNEWYVKANRAFQTTEWMKVTIDNIVYEITVTDAINYTITYQSGSDGQFADGTTTNVVSYSLTTSNVIKYSHTPNVDDTGLQNGNYANNLNTNEVVTIPGATTLTVDIYYNGESVSYDWLSVWAGNYPSYTASGNTTSTGYVTTDMGAPNNNNKFGGSQSGSYTVNGNSLTNMGHTTLTISGDSVTFGFKSDSSSAGKGYGYYAIVSGTGEVRTITSGEYKEPIPNDSEYRFKEWSQDPDLINSNTTVTASYEEDIIDKGTYDGVDWKIKGDGTLVIGKTGITQTYANNTSRSSSSWPWYQYRSQITGIEFIGPVNGNGSHSGMFYECSNAINITNISNFNTSNATKMNSMFYKCSSLTSLNISNFNTINVTTMYAMFDHCENLTSLDVSHFDTNNVTNMGNMFYYCRNLTSLDVSEFDTSNVTTMYAMFAWCDNLRSLDVSGFDTTKVTAMDSMFFLCSSLTTIDVSGFDTSKVTTMISMFSDCNNVTNLDVSGFDTSKVTHMQSMFSGCNNLTSLDVSGFDTTNVMYMSGVFSGCSSLTTIDVSNFNTSKVTEMDYMFSGCSGLTILDLSNFNTSYVKDLSNMFMNCNNIISLELSSFDTANVTTMEKMFQDCSSLISIDVSSFDTSKVTTMSYMFKNCSNITTIYASDGWNIGTVYYSSDMFSGCTHIVGGQGTSYNSSNVDETRAKIDGGSTDPGYLTYKTHNFDAMAYAVYDSADGSLTFFKDDVAKYYNKQREDTKTYYYNIEKTSFESKTDNPWYDRRNYVESVRFNDEIIPNNMAYWFCGFANQNLTIDFTNLDTSNVTSMELMLYDCGHLTSIDVSEFETSNVTNMYSMFDGCYSLTTLDLSNFDTSNVTNMMDMFFLCSSLTSLDLTNFDTSNVIDMEGMFSDCNSLASLDVSMFDTSKVTTMHSMFSGCNNLTSLDLSSFDTSNVNSTQEMFSNCSNLITIYVSDIWNVVNAQYHQRMFDGCTSIVGGKGTVYDSAYVNKTRAIIDEGTTNPGYLTDINPQSEAYAEFDSSNGQLRIFRDEANSYTDGQVIGTKTYYAGIENITGVTAPKWYSKKENIITVVIEDYYEPKTAYDMFYDCGNLTTITGIEYLNTSNVTNMRNMFAYCNSLTSLDVTNFDTSNVVDMSQMFIECNSLTTLDVSSFDTSIVTTMQSMFWECSNLTSLDLSNFNTSSVTNMHYMFESCINLASLDVSSFNTSNVTDMSYMFDCCAALTSLDVSSFNTSNVAGMSYMFRYCNSLTNLDISFFNTGNVTSMNGMFDNCSNLTSLDLSNFNTVKVTNMAGMFDTCSSLESLDISSFNTSNVTTMRNMFDTCSNLTSLDLSNFNTANVINMANMFLDTTDLNTLKLGTNWNFLSDNGLTKSWLRDGDTIVYTAAQLTSSYDGSTMTGTYRAVVLLTITEEVRGEFADINKNFNFTINVQNDEVGINTTHAYTGSKTGNFVFVNGNESFTLKHGESISTYLPYGNAYSITQDSDGYILSKTNDTGTLDDNITASFTDTLNGTTPTGIFLDLIPYILLLFGSIFGVLWLKKFAKI